MTDKSTPRKKTGKSSRLGHDPFADISVDTEKDRTVKTDNIEPDTPPEETVSNDKQASLHLPSNFTIAAVEEVRGKMSSLIDMDKPSIDIESAEVESVDTAAIQLLYAFTEKAITSGRTIHWHSYSQKIEDAAKILGINMLTKNN